MSKNGESVENMLISISSQHWKNLDLKFYGRFKINNHDLAKINSKHKMKLSRELITFSFSVLEK